MAIILTDIDDCTLAWADAFQAFLATKGYHINERARDHHNIPELYKITIPETIELVREFQRSSLMGQIAPEPCAEVVLPELYEQGHRFVAISACLNEPEVVEHRTRNLEEAFGFKWEAIHCVGLSLNKKDVLSSYPSSIWVEDLLKNAVDGAEIGHHAFLLDRPYNRSEQPLPGVTRVRDWHSIARHVRLDGV
jgi:5'(3')-deoxyribonucleotidase